MRARIYGPLRTGTYFWTSGGGPTRNGAFFTNFGWSMSERRLTMHRYTGGCGSGPANRALW
ncbi:hypothetical protein [Mumia zhuanghuii]|uniref:Uncharacterized protein n=1 Tax=Mumia zhuanghuii TaxID=2585211 RepID=A0A5C4M0F8_9ACTN|nr:hypothetical protein [Mumia zhuanghuii]TNC26015.1 hypothetical protein FHE65_34770 [Mumia zhuanghuii]